MKRTKVKAVSIILAGFMSISIAITGKSFVVLANENNGTTNSMQRVLFQNLESEIKDKDEFTGYSYLNKDTEKSALKEEGNPEDRIRIIVELSESPATLMTEDGEQPSQEQIQVVKDAQIPIQEQVEEKTGEEVRHTYGNLINGFSMSVKRKDIEKIKSVDGIVDIKEANVYYPDMTSAKELTQAVDVWKDYGYKGEGLVISVVDTGIDYRHKDMRLTDSTKMKLNKDNISKGKGQYYTEKVPYGYNFADENNEVVDIGGDMHGMHVSGILAANASKEDIENNNGIQGVAPEAQVLAMKVFSNNQNIEVAYADDIIAAIEESVKLDSDVINMSLGSAAGYRDALDPEQVAIKNATDDGVICVVSAGNEANSINPNIIEHFSDIGTLGTPGIATDALQVASCEKSQLTLEELSMTKMSDLSSWGPAPNLEFAPQITGPGGNIYSTLNDNRYGSMSGTSMSAPHVAGATALIIEGLKDKGIKLQGRELVEFVKKTIINTAKTLEENTLTNEKLPYSPRRQGSGIIQTKEAINNMVLAVGEDNQATISLKEIGSKTDFEITLKNYSDKEEKYSVKSLGSVLTAFTPSMLGKSDLKGVMAFDTTLKGATLKFDNDNINVPANGQAIVKVTLNVEEKSVTDNFVEGFIRFIAEDGSTPSLVVPYMGYYGDWSREKIIDGAVWNSNSISLSPSFAATEVLGKYSYLGYEGKDSNGNIKIDSEKIAISPNNDKAADAFVPALYTLRNAKEVKVDLLDKDKKIISSDINRDVNLRKKILTSKEGNKAALYQSLAWDGTIYSELTGKNEQAQEGQYYLNYKAKVDGDNTKYQDFIMPVKVDVTPAVGKLISKETSSTPDYKLEVNFNGEYKDGLINKIVLSINGKQVTDFTVKDDVLTAQLNLDDNAVNKIQIRTVDNAYNTSINDFEIVSGNIISDAKFVNFPEGQSLTENKLLVKGIYSGLVENILINGEAPDSIKDGEFNKMINLSEGLNTVTLYAEDHSGKVIANYAYKVLCNTEAPLLNVTEPIANEEGLVITAKDVITVKGSVSDDTNGYKLFLNGENKLNVPSSGINGEKTYREFEYEVPVVDGDIIILKAIDSVGHETVKKLKIKMDKTIPEINIKGIENGKIYKNNVKASITVVPEYAKLNITLNGAEYKGEEVKEEGNYELVAHAIGMNNVENTVKVIFSVDKTAPIISIGNIEEGKAYSENIIPNIKVEEGSVISATLNEKEYNGEAIIEEGNYVLLIKAVDKAGNIAEKVVAFLIDKTPPKVTIEDVIDGMAYDYEVKPLIKSDEDGEIIVSINDKNYNGEVIKENGEYLLKVLAKDKAGNVTEVLTGFSIKLPEGPGPNPTPTAAVTTTRNIDVDIPESNSSSNETNNSSNNETSKDGLEYAGEKNPIYVIVSGLILVAVGTVFVLRKRMKKR
ncbi:S8 family serine peptidase [Clostridium gasigenes]|uniref:S8 family serine peptidase n=1 Tax=Clostridium gasigenes TaxID=94869 RepID=A0A7X0VQG0_9CLOT|nr:S8 family serine peptidase [Clostridium gasigenes]MBB6713535.1 S8 family serine peptidase [Clostridium gasigenes]